MSVECGTLDEAARPRAPANPCWERRREAGFRSSNVFEGRHRHGHGRRHVPPPAGWPRRRGAGQPHGKRLGWRLGCCASATALPLRDHRQGRGGGTQAGRRLQLAEAQPQGTDAVFCETMAAPSSRKTKRRLADSGVRLAACYAALDKEETCRRAFEFAKGLGIETLDGRPPPRRRRCSTCSNGSRRVPREPGSPQSRPALNLVEAGDAAGRSPRPRQADRRVLRRGPLGPLRARSGGSPRKTPRPHPHVRPEGTSTPRGNASPSARQGGHPRDTRRTSSAGVSRRLGNRVRPNSAGPRRQIAQSVAYFDRVAEELAGPAAAKK